MSWYPGWRAWVGPMSGIWRKGSDAHVPWGSPEQSERQTPLRKTLPYRNFVGGGGRKKF